MLNKQFLRLMPFVISLGIALFLGKFAWKILELIYPIKSFDLLLLEATLLENEIKKWATGSIVFALMYLIVSHVWERRMFKKSQNETETDFKFNWQWIILLSLRIVFSCYFVSFWGNYVSYKWFSNISLMIGGLGFDVYIRMACVLIQSLFGIYIVVSESWQKLMGPASHSSAKMSVRIFSLAYISVAFYLLSLAKFPGNSIIPALITSVFILISISTRMLILALGIRGNL